MTEPTGSRSGSAAAMPVWMPAPDAVVVPLQYAVARKRTISPSAGEATSSGSGAPAASHRRSRTCGTPQGARHVLGVEDGTLVQQHEPEGGARRHDDAPTKGSGEQHHAPASGIGPPAAALGRRKVLESSRQRRFTAVGMHDEAIGLPGTHANPGHRRQALAAGGVQEASARPSRYRKQQLVVLAPGPRQDAAVGVRPQGSARQRPRRSARRPHPRARRRRWHRQAGAGRRRGRRWCPCRPRRPCCGRPVDRVRRAPRAAGSE